MNICTVYIEEFVVWWRFVVIVLYFLQAFLYMHILIY